MNTLELAQRALAAAGAGDGVQATASRERSLMLRFAASRPTQATALDDMSVELAVLRNGHVARASTNDVGDDALARCARRAAAAAEAAERAAGAGPYPGFPAPAPARAHAGHDGATAQLDAAAGGAELAAAFGVAERAGLEAHGIWTAAEVETAVASSEGAAASNRVTDAFMKVICIAPSGRSGYASHTGVAASALDGAALAERAAGKAAARGEPVRGALVGRLGSSVAAPAINLSDSPRFPRTLPRAFDAEGVPKAPLPLIQDGVARGVVHDVLSASMAGASSTGHALAAGGSSSGPLPTNLVLAGGGATDEAELCAPIERGVYVTRLWYANVVRPSETLVTAVSRDGTFLIEDGALTRPLADMRLTDSVLGILGRVQALTATPALVSDGEFYGRRFANGVACPAVRAGSVRFTGSG